jgi:UDP-sulfoquinovose synthase
MERTILVIGGDGYIGWPLAMTLAKTYPNEKIIIADNERRRNAIISNGFKTLYPITLPKDRLKIAGSIYGMYNIIYKKIDANSIAIETLIKNERPHTIYHLAQQCSAPYSMKGVDEALDTIRNNEESNVRILWAIREYSEHTHLIKIGSFGEYAKAGIDITEGYFTPTLRGKKANEAMPYPRQADDIYHITKINDSNFIAMACRIWGLRVTDVMQSTVFGILTNEMDDNELLFTRFDYDHIYGTVANRFLAQAISGHPLTVYGSGHQRTGLMALKDAVYALAALVENAPNAGMHKVVNHITETNFSVLELAKEIKHILAETHPGISIINTFDPRQENIHSKQAYQIDSSVKNHLKFHSTFSAVVLETAAVVNRFKQNINKAQFTPNIQWGGSTNNYSIKSAEKDSSYFDDELHWGRFRKEHFNCDRINLNPGTLGNVSKNIKNVYQQYSGFENIEGFPLGNYAHGREAFKRIKALCNQIWPSPGYMPTVLYGTTQTISLVALAALRKLYSIGSPPFRVITTTHEHEGGIGPFEALPEFEVFHLSDDILYNDVVFAEKVNEIKPALAFFSSVFYKTGKKAPVHRWCNTVKKNTPACKIIADVSQAIGLFNLPFGEADLIIGSTHKWLFGPHGYGLAWIKDDFRQWIEGFFWLQSSVAYNTDIEHFSLPGGHDFLMYAAVEESLLLFKNISTNTIIKRCALLKEYFEPKLFAIFTKNDIACTASNVEKNTPFIAVEFTSYNPYPLYEFLNQNSVHLKYIKSKNTSVIRIGIPYFETKDRLDKALNLIKSFIQQQNPQTRNPLCKANLMSHFG